MAHIDCSIDTEPMARELNSVVHHVNATTTAVVAMQTAVVAAETKAANHVCNNVNKGFYSLIMSQISQKVAKLQSEVDSHLMQLRQYKKQLEGVQQRMGRDYKMITARYTKLFNGLNVNLKHRVYNLDKPAIDFAVKEMDQISNRSLYMTSMVPLSQRESLTESQKIVVSNMKSKGSKVIATMHQFFEDVNEQNRLTEKILLSNRRRQESTEIAVPVIISESNFDSMHSSYDVIVCKKTLDRNSQSAIRQTVDASLNSLQWNTGKDNPETKEVENELMKMIADSGDSKRLKETMTMLFQKSDYQSLIG